MKSVCACTALFLFAMSAAAQNYPSKPIRVLIATTAGGTTDTVSRLAGQELEIGRAHV